MELYETPSQFSVYWLGVSSHILSGKRAESFNAPCDEIDPTYRRKKQKKTGAYCQKCFHRYKGANLQIKQNRWYHQCHAAQCGEEGSHSLLDHGCLVDPIESWEPYIGDYPQQSTEKLHAGGDEPQKESFQKAHGESNPAAGRGNQYTRKPIYERTGGFAQKNGFFRNRQTAENPEAFSLQRKGCG